MKRNKIAAGAWAAAALALLSGCATVPRDRPESSADDGYFLSMKQKGQLLWTGRIQDAENRWYDIWIVPGYVQPGRRAKTYLRKAGSDFAEYAQPQKYRDLVDDSQNAFEWAYQDCLVDYTIKGVPRAWKRHWSEATEHTQQRVFGWWLAYPWALMEGSVETAVRVPLGLAGTLLGTAWGVAGSPACHAVDSAVAGTWHLGVDAVLFPAIGCAWNTAVAPPLALVGQKPAPERVDGFWVCQMSAEELQSMLRADDPVRPQDIAALAQWGRQLSAVARPFDERRQAHHRQFRGEREALDRKERAAWAALSAEEAEAIRDRANDPEHRAALAHLRERGFDRAKTERATEALREQLRAQGVPAGDIDQILSLLSRHPASLAIPAPVRPKTDPVQDSLKTLSDID